VNDKLGHPMGDKLLQSVASRILNTIRETDTVARLGGDEFAVIGTNHDNLDDVVKLANRILSSLAKPYVFPDATLNSSASIGATIFPYDNSTPVEIVRHADVALNKAKQKGRNQFVIFDEKMNSEFLDRKKVENDLVQAIEAEEFVLFYQPQVDLSTGKTIGAEALIRWNHPDRGLLTPDKFLEIAEKTRLIGPITEWVIREAAAFLGRMISSGRNTFKLSINLSADDFRNDNLTDIVWKALKANDVPGTMLEVEVTESMVIPDVMAAVEMLNKLKEIGISVAIDDFGVGYSSMSYLRDFSPNVLKIDRSFITDCLDKKENTRIVEGIINLGHSLGISIIAEGIENQEVLAFLAKSGCEVGQGYLFGKPMPERDFFNSFI
jgi:diguanylate cyclase (GGDEF)-like protein